MYPAAAQGLMAQGPVAPEAALGASAAGSEESANDVAPAESRTGRAGASMLRHPWLLWALVLVQVGCGAYFLWEILAAILGLPTIPLRWQTRELVDIGASLGLVLGAVLGVVLAINASRAIRRADSARRVTSGEFTEVVEDYLRKLDLTPAETEVAWFLLKGMSLTEIADLRSTREGTVKAQCTAIYRKAGVSGKSQLFSLLVEDVLL